MGNNQTYICPNCGANINNTKNCEYCGSLLIRFVASGHEGSITQYKGEDKSFPWLKQELGANIKHQKSIHGETSKVDTVVSTDLYFTKRLLKDGEVRLVLKHGTTVVSVLSKNTKIKWNDGTEYEHNSEIGLIVVFSFNTSISNKLIENTVSVDYDKDCLSKFKHLDSYPLFEAHYNNHVNINNATVTSVQYLIDFGEDYVGAANLITEILKEVYQFNDDQDFIIGTNIGDSIDSFRDSAMAQIYKQQSSDNLKDSVAVYANLGKLGAKKGKEYWNNKKYKKWIILAIIGIVLIYLWNNVFFYWF